MRIEMAELFSKEHTSAVKLRKQVLGGKIGTKKRSCMSLSQLKTRKWWAPQRSSCILSALHEYAK